MDWINYFFGVPINTNNLPLVKKKECGVEDEDSLREYKLEVYIPKMKNGT